MSRICVVGRGNWGTKLQGILFREGLLADWPLLPRRTLHENSDLFRSRVRAVLQKSRGDVVWLAVPPADQALMVEAVIDLGRHVIIEKPWMVSHSITKELVNRAQKCGVMTGVSYIYCFLDSVIKQAELFKQAEGFEGDFFVATDNRLGLPSVYNLGAHLLAIRGYVCPNAKLLNLRTGYNSENTRSVTFYYGSSRKHIEFLYTSEPIVQRFAMTFLNGITSGTSFKFDLAFSSKITKELEMK
jgi:GFO/IDH/MocA oxidoreductase family protein